MSKTAMKLALEALENAEYGDYDKKELNKAIIALREELAREAPTAWVTAGPHTVPLVTQPAQQEPVAWPCLIAEADFSENTVTLAMQCTDYKVSAGTHWLYTSPPARRTWVGLAEVEITTSLPYSVTRDKGCFHAGALWADAKLKDKNNA